MLMVEKLLATTPPPGGYLSNKASIVNDLSEISLLNTENMRLESQDIDKYGLNCVRSDEQVSGNSYLSQVYQPRAINRHFYVIDNK